MKKEKTVRTYQRRTKSGKMVTVREHKASYNAAEEARKAAAKKAGAGSEFSKKKATMEESPLGFSADDYKEWYHWDMEDDANNEAALRVEKALIKKMGKKAYNKYLEDMTNSYSARGHKKAHKALLDEHTTQQKKQDDPKTTKSWEMTMKDKYSDSTGKHAEIRSLLGVSHALRLAPSGYTKGAVTTAIKELRKEGSPKSLKMADKLEKTLLDKIVSGAKSSSAKTEKAEPKTKKLTARDYQSMSDEDLQKHYANYRYKTNSSLSRSEQYHKKTIEAEVTRRSEAKTKAEEKSARKTVGGLVSGNTWKYNSSDGSFSTLDSTSWGRPDSSRVKKLIQKAKDAGWKKANHSDSMQPDDKGYRSTERYVSPDGKHELTYRYSAGDFSRNNHYVTIRRIKSDEAPTKQAESKDKKGKKSAEKKNDTFTEKQILAYERKLMNTRNKYVGGPGPSSYRYALKKRQEAMDAYHKTAEGKAMQEAYKKYSTQRSKESRKKNKEKRLTKKVEEARKLISDYEKKKGRKK